MFQDQIIAAIRTGCAALGTTIVVALVGWLTSVGVDVELDSTTATVLAGLLFGIAIAFYNVLVNWLAANVHPNIGYLLGVPKTAVYEERETELLGADTIITDRE